MRLSPIVPFNLQNYALGVTAIPLCNTHVTLIGIGPGPRIYAYFHIFCKGVGTGPTFSPGCCPASVCWQPFALAILVIR